MDCLRKWHGIHPVASHSVTHPELKVRDSCPRSNFLQGTQHGWEERIAVCHQIILDSKFVSAELAVGELHKASVCSSVQWGKHKPAARLAGRSLPELPSTTGTQLFLTFLFLFNLVYTKHHQGHLTPTKRAAVRILPQCWLERDWRLGSPA